MINTQNFQRYKSFRQNYTAHSLRNRLGGSALNFLDQFVQISFIDTWSWFLWSGCSEAVRRQLSTVRQWRSSDKVQRRHKRVVCILTYVFHATVLLISARLIMIILMSLEKTTFCWRPEVDAWVADDAVIQRLIWRLILTSASQSPRKYITSLISSNSYAKLTLCRQNQYTESGLQKRIIIFDTKLCYN